jgi:predicted dehydrogenase
VGCGFVADLYMKGLGIHPELELAGVFDRDVPRAQRFAAHHGVAIVYSSLQAVLEDRSVSIVVNLTNPRSHYEISRQCLEAGKHVYSEKPLAMRLEEARQLVELAEAKSLFISSAPSTVLGETAQTMWKALRAGTVGPVRAVYAEMDDGLVHRMSYRQWQSAAGAPWPYKDEFEVGCTIEHAGYVLSWLAAFFGPAREVTAFASVQIPDKLTDEPLEQEAPDFSVACVRFTSGVAARLTCSIIAPHDHRLNVFGDEGILSTPDNWDFRSPVYVQKYMNIRRRMVLSPWRRRLRLVGRENRLPKYRGASRVDFARGIAEMASAIRESRPARLGGRFSLHVNELTLAIHQAREQGGLYRLTSSFEPIKPMEWAGV